MPLLIGTYRTKAGSTVTITERGCETSFDWVEEPGACCDCRPNRFPDDEGYLKWTCCSFDSDHDGGKAKLEPVE
jgi:hypothetical protein